MKVNSWEDIKVKYPHDRHEMNEKTERDFVEDCFYIYEKEGFSKKFWSPYDDLESKIGERFEVIGRCTEDQNPLHTLPLWNIRFEDGTESCVYPEEIIPSEMRANGCQLENIQ